MKSGLFLSAAVVLALTVFGTPANAALTSSEKGQIKDFITAAKLETVGQVRSLVARTDLTPEESSGVLVDAIAPLAWSDAKGAFLKELVMGGPASTRAPLAVAATKAILARWEREEALEDARLAKAAAESIRAAADEAARSGSDVAAPSIIKVTLKTEQNGDFHTLH
jgi:hypothetical protein